ncbi:MAG: hypothetical protein V4619_18245 [Bacteroidota bacterium]
MKKLALISVILFAACNQPQKEKTIEIPVTHYYKTDKDPVRHAIIKYDAYRDSNILGAKGNATNLTKADLLTIEALIKKETSKYNQSAKGKLITAPEKYYKQLISIIDHENEKIVWVDCACQVFGDDWKKYLLNANDGGTCNFHLKINLTKGIVIGFWVNGLA